MSSHLIDNNIPLEECRHAISEAGWITLDTEFMRERTYYPQLCLLQIGDGANAWCVDALADLHLDPLLEQICERDHWRVLHAARQDLEIFYRLRGNFTSPLFDTQVAAGLLGLDAQVGYAGLIKELLGIELEKGYQRANWARRPLPEAQLEYALDDVRYLAEVYPLIQEKLDSLGRLEWVIEDSRKLCDRNLYSVDPATAYLRIGQLRALVPVEQHIVRALAQWREQRAQQADKPRSWIASDNTLIYLAQIKPDSRARLQKVKGLSPQLIDNQADAILTAVAEGASSDNARLMSHPEPLTDSEQKLYKEMKKALDDRAKELGIDAPALGTRKDVEMVVRGNTDSALLNGWRAGVVGEQLLAMR